MEYRRAAASIACDAYRLAAFPTLLQLFAIRTMIREQLAWRFRPEASLASYWAQAGAAHRPLRLQRDPQMSIPRARNFRLAGRSGPRAKLPMLQLDKHWMSLSHVRGLKRRPQGPASPKPPPPPNRYGLGSSTVDVLDATLNVQQMSRPGDAHRTAAKAALCWHSLQPMPNRRLARTSSLNESLQQWTALWAPAPARLLLASDVLQLMHGAHPPLRFVFE